MADLIKCHTCAAWDAFPSGENGLCRRYAPRPVMYGLFVDGDGRYGEVKAVFPHTREGDGCCEGIPR